MRTLTASHVEMVFGSLPPVPGNGSAHAMSGIDQDHHGSKGGESVDAHVHGSARFFLKKDVKLSYDDIVTVVAGTK